MLTRMDLPKAVIVLLEHLYQFFSLCSFYFVVADKKCTDSKQVAEASEKGKKNFQILCWFQI